MYTGDVSTVFSKFYGRFGIVMNNKDNCFYVSSIHAIYKVSSTGMPILLYFNLMSIIEGAASILAGSTESGNVDGNGPSARLNCPCAIALDQQSGNLFVCDRDNHLIRKITPQGVKFM